MTIEFLYGRIVCKRFHLGPFGLNLLSSLLGLEREREFNIFDFQNSQIFFEFLEMEFFNKKKRLFDGKEMRNRIKFFGKYSQVQ